MNKYDFQCKHKKDFDNYKYVIVIFLIYLSICGVTSPQTAIILQAIDLLKKIRQEQGLSQEIVFFDTGIHIGRIEQGKSNITLKTLEKLCTYYHTDIFSFFKRMQKTKQ